jgi:hypothetical protein
MSLEEIMKARTIQKKTAMQIDGLKQIKKIKKPKPVSKNIRVSGQANSSSPMKPKIKVRGNPKIVIKANLRPEIQVNFGGSKKKRPGPIKRLVMAAGGKKNPMNSAVKAGARSSAGGKPLTRVIQVVTSDSRSGARRANTKEASKNSRARKLDAKRKSRGGHA